MNNFDYVAAALAVLRDRVREETAKQFCDAYTKLLETEVHTRRTKTQALILEMSKLKNELLKFEATYEHVKNEYGNIESVDKYILEVKKRIRQISSVKNRPIINQ